MIRLVQHVPAFVNDGEGGQVAEAETQEQLLAVPWVANYAKDDLVLPQGAKEPFARPFHRWSLSDRHLMVEHDEGMHWWVVGTVTDGLERLTLPIWRIPETVAADKLKPGHTFAFAAWAQGLRVLRTVEGALEYEIDLSCTYRAPVVRCGDRVDRFAFQLAGRRDGEIRLRKG